MNKGTLVEFQVKGSLRLGVLDRPEGKKNWIVLDDQRQSHTVHPRSFTFQFDGEMFEPEGLSALEAEAQGYIDPDNLPVAWELLTDTGESVDPAALALLLFSDQGAAFCYAAHRMLVTDKIYFKQKGDRYEPRSANQVQELLHQIEREAQRKAEWEGFLSRVRQRLAGESVEWQKSDRPRLEIIEKLALLGDESNQKAPAQEILSALGKGFSEEAAFHLLVELGIWQTHENLELRRRQIPVDFSEALLTMAQHCLSNPLPDADAHRLDLTSLKTYTIDDESTREIDDALSVESLSDGRQRLWIHIADPTRWLLPGDDLDLEARRRCTTVYLPTGIVPMFPLELATGPMSLVQGEVHCALSFGVVLTDEGAIADYQIAASLVKPTYRLTYEDVDEMLDLDIQAEPELLAIAHWAKVREAWRAQQGA
ncbi:MAG: RNB domain-containing ribonuclease, partial [Cyanobacteria bacterium P01_D01_bin.71]